MKHIEQLQQLALIQRTAMTSWQACVDWAIERLRHDDEGDDLDVVMLAAATHDAEAAELVPLILERYLGPNALNDELAIGKRIVELYALFQSGQEDADSLDPQLWRLFYDFGHPEWLQRLARNCEYATDIPAFEKPFLDEFAYIADLWANATTLAQFNAAYDPAVSQSHDYVGQSTTAKPAPHSHHLRLTLARWFDFFKVRL
ncbi:MAG: hypothetical protein LBE58_16300 [Comamonas sp.]|jgi:hypothetical protein|nr:hypothetical protein [Comamonas sp.]